MPEEAALGPERQEAGPERPEAGPEKAASAEAEEVTEPVERSRLFPRRVPAGRIHTLSNRRIHFID